MACVVQPGNPGGFQKVFFGREEVAIPLQGSVPEATKAYPSADVFINFASFRRHAIPLSPSKIHPYHQKARAMTHIAAHHACRLLKVVLPVSHGCFALLWTIFPPKLIGHINGLTSSGGRDKRELCVYAALTSLAWKP